MEHYYIRNAKIDIFLISDTRKTKVRFRVKFFEELRLASGIYRHIFEKLRDVPETGLSDCYPFP
jgi:hypothetical protein